MTLTQEAPVAASNVEKFHFVVPNVWVQICPHHVIRMIWAAILCNLTLNKMPTDASIQCDLYQGPTTDELELFFPQRTEEDRDDFLWMIYYLRYAILNGLSPIETNYRMYPPEPFDIWSSVE
uniref:Uncharacterized protein n=1 Tax=Lutzomyia longipalpis TaxID=7200 RepID=A0A1B0CH06_LUTLO